MGKQTVTARRYAKVFYTRITEDNIFDLAAQLAYYFLLSLFPFLIFALALLNYLDITSADVLGILKRVAPTQSFGMIKKNLQLVLDVQRGGLLSFGILFAVWTASNAINALIRALNRAYNVEESRSFFVSKGIAILLTLGMIVVIIVALTLPVFGEYLGEFVLNHLGFADQFRVVLVLIRWLISFLLIVFVLSCLYYFAPNKKVYFKDVIFGAVIAAVGWQVASLGFSYYVGHLSNFSATYGSLGGVIILMIWFYLTALVIIVGGEINAVNWFFERKHEEL